MSLPLLLLSASLLAGTPAAAGEDALAALLPKLAEAERARAARNADVTVDFVTVVEELDGEGKVGSRTDILERRTTRGGQPTSEVLRATRDGRDVTAEVRAQRQKEQEKRRKEGRRDNASPFVPEVQGRYRFVLKGPVEGKAGQVRIGLVPREKDAELLEGEAVVDAERAVLLSLEGHPAKLPPLADRVDLRFDFGRVTPTGNDLSSLSIDAEGGLLFVRKHMRITSRAQWKEASLPSPAARPGGEDSLPVARAVAR
jgi:hypothetical protein